MLILIFCSVIKLGLLFRKEYLIELGLVFLAVTMCNLLLLMFLTGESLTCYECESNSGWKDCPTETKKFCKPGWLCVTMKEKPEGMTNYYFRRTCSEADICDKFCLKKKNCVYECCNSDLCNKGTL